jgi:hypothetical protein
MPKYPFRGEEGGEEEGKGKIIFFFSLFYFYHEGFFFLGPGDLGCLEFHGKGW